MSATIYSHIVDLDQLIPRMVDIDEESNDTLTPWVFEHSRIADYESFDDRPKERTQFKDVLYRLCMQTFFEADEAGALVDALKPAETVTLPRKNWQTPRREYFTDSMMLQGAFVSSFVETIYYNLRDIMDGGPELHFPVSKFRQEYVIGGQRYASRLDGAAVVGLPEARIPVISFVGYYEKETWTEFLREIVSIMLGQLAKNIDRAGLQTQEVFAVGLYGRCIYIARGYFTSDLIACVHTKGCSENERVDLQFTRSYDLRLKEDWMEAIRGFTRLLRYLVSGTAKVGSIQLHVDHTAPNPRPP
ncbi:hypothetical protein BO94DRAFT_559178 [Aspergillus sclerotioniger CBS 115572]|uniref:Uncharacterized protein n=1 Tax=Aspergillus sclerotioniger CBS 115572 TaxID=1450535 RepID=A0A317VSF6_9EURO|nr:hypothetical protein BO94DRAFT_559178 [Aspergillus sclerotioniger CBS 115572]PWY77314.1 hypothetical protein BO94DRAFT_559178 [Aspergillus sclerotioniger CBS 115572]